MSARLATLPPPPSARARRISSATLTACVVRVSSQDAADARAAAELSDLERLRFETLAAVHAGRGSRSTMPARGRGRR